jgi:Zn-dependent protease
MAFFEYTASKKTLSLLGFPTRVRPGFLIFLAILAFLYPFPLGVWVAGAVAIFTVIHELGHALAARRAGCKASISLDFMIAYASYESDNPLPWSQKLRIALAGPLAQIFTALAVLFALGVNPLSRDDIAQNEMTAALWWAGLALGALNLVPLLPLDGGAVVAAIAEKISPDNGRAIVLRLSIALTIILAAASVSFGFAGFLPLFFFMLLMQWQSLTIPQRITQIATDPQFSTGGNSEIDEAIISSLLDQEKYEQAAQYARRAYQHCPAFATAMLAARAHLKLGDDDSAVSWLHAAQSSELHGNTVADELVGSELFSRLRYRSDISTQWFTKV